MKIINSQSLSSALSFFEGGIIFDADNFFPPNNNSFDHEGFIQTLSSLLLQRKPSFIAIFSYYIHRDDLFTILQEANLLVSFQECNSVITDVYNCNIDFFVCTSLLQIKTFTSFILNYVSLTLQSCVTIVTNNQVLIPFMFQSFTPDESRYLVLIYVSRKLTYELKSSNILCIVKPITSEISEGCKEPICQRNDTCSNPFYKAEIPTAPKMETGGDLKSYSNQKRVSLDSVTTPKSVSFKPSIETIKIEKAW